VAHDCSWKIATIHLCLILWARTIFGNTETEAGFMVSQSTFVGTGAGPRSRIGFLTGRNEQRLVVQDFARFPESLEWELGQAYLSACGTKGFVQDKTPIPFAINNDGALSRGRIGVRYYEDRPGVNGPLHGTSSVKEISLYFLKGA